MALLPIVEQIRNALLQNENSGSYSQAGVLTLSTGRSGYSVGAFQFDFSHASTTTLSLFQSMLQSTASVTNLTPAQINQIMQGITVAGGSSLITPALTQQINQALQTSAGVAFTTTVDGASLNTAAEVVENLIAAANTNPAGGGDLAYGNLNPTAVAELAEYVNQFGPNVPQLTSFLSGGIAAIGPGGQTVVTAGGAPTLTSLNANFFSLTTQFQQNPGNYQHFLRV